MNMQVAIEDKLRALAPAFLRVENESHRHNVPPGAQSHFKVTVVSARFGGRRLLARHRMVNELLTRELAALHALALHTLTPEEWAARGESPAAVPESPPCLGGSKVDKRDTQSQ